MHTMTQIVTWNRRVIKPISKHAVLKVQKPERDIFFILYMRKEVITRNSGKKFKNQIRIEF